MVSIQERLLIVVTAFSSVTKRYLSPFGLRFSGRNASIKGISFYRCTDNLSDTLSWARTIDVLICNEQVSPPLEKSGFLKALTQEKKSVTLVLHRLNLPAYSSWVRGEIGQLLFEERIEGAAHGGTVELLIRLGNAFNQRDQQEYLNALQEYYSPEFSPRIEELKRKILNEFSKEDCLNLHEELSNPSIENDWKVLLHKHPNLLDCLREVGKSSVAEQEFYYRRQLAGCLYPE